MVCLESKQVVTGGQFKRLNTLLFLTKFSFKRLKKKTELDIICPTCRKM